MRLATRYGWRSAPWHAFTQIASLALTCASCIYPVVATGLGTWLLAGPAIAGVAGRPFPQPVPLRLTIACALFAVVVLALLMQMIEEMVRGGGEARARYRALHGDAAAMPVARAVPFSEEVPNVTYLPLKGLVSPVSSAHAVSADDRGVRVRAPSGRERVVRWEDARLLEVIMGKDDASLVYALRGQGRPVTWSDRRQVAKSVDAQLTYQRLNAQMLAVVHARTGLLPRTCVPTLQADQPAERAASTGATTRRGPLGRLVHAVSVVAGGIVVFAFAGGLAWAAYICVTAPLTSAVAWNIYAAATLAVLPLLLLWVVVRFVARSVLPRRHPSIPGAVPMLPPAPAPGRYALRWRDPWWEHALGVLVGIIFALDGVPLAMGIAQALSDNGGTALLPPGIIAEQVLFLFVIIGALVAIASAVTWPRAVSDVVVDEAGIVSGSLLIPWEQVKSLTWNGTPDKPNSGKVVVTSVLGTDATSITWPERPARVLPVRDASPIPPLELAALVVARSGKSLRAGGT